ncbi:probable serine/threonine-protein kinase kinX isoform X2 [Schistocerca gregaria]|uniref:probable serine/threonine-protein kinase kinX isoform X2 n=1 Tax=Schistocerca gregaria TaxID=7010 RepID=UPI00211EBF70|nr:probable serine/threonine-protein kinase kinX isoform X2 [Schistocerca gregaria]XP_049847927.1 probable serine/threonine-protein kinase kinX isoform X2 [Schistocerca gregaria]
MLDQEVYQGIRKNYVLKPIPPEKWLNPNDIDWCAEKLLGKGTYGRVVKGTWLGKPSAIKIANTDHGQEATDLLKEECSLMSNLDHPNIVKVYGCCDKNGSFVMVMELLHSSLSNLLESYRPGSRSKKSTPSKVRKNVRVPIWKILRDVAAGIEYLHGLDLIHRDVKPSNILLSRSTFQAKLCDFGLARKFEAGNNSSMTDAGTSPYKAPEVNYGLGRYDRSVDIFSLGRVIERDLCPLLRDENLKQLADYCTQSIGTEHLSFKSPSSRPSAAQVLERIKEHIRKYRPGRVVLSLDPEEIERVKMKMQNVKRFHDEDTEGNKGASLAGSDKGMDVDESLGTECNDTSNTAQKLSSRRTRKTKNVKESKALADDQQAEKRELRDRSKKPLPGNGLQFCAPRAQMLDSRYRKTSSMKLRLRCADKKKRVAMKRETHSQEKTPSKKSGSNRSDASDFVKSAMFRLLCM